MESNEQRLPSRQSTASTRTQTCCPTSLLVSPLGETPINFFFFFYFTFFLGDLPMQQHPIFRQFSDYCAKVPGEDKNWTVGTEHRQLQIYEDELKDPWKMKNMMVDHLKRRHFIIDADIKVI